MNAHWDLEIGAITELVAERGGPALLFDKIPGSPPGYRVFSNGGSTAKRTALVFNLPLDQDLSPLQMLDIWRKRYQDFKPILPVEVKKAPLKENILSGEDIDLFKFPACKWHEGDGGRYIGTGDCVITRDPEATGCNFDKDVDLIRGIRAAGSDPVIIPQLHAGQPPVRSIMIIDARKPLAWIKDFPVVNIFSPDYRKKIAKKWRL